MTYNVIPFNPLDKTNLGNSVAEAMLSQKVMPLANVGQFAGAGLYAIYYTGDFPCYELLARRNRGEQYSAPIYVGRAEAEGARKGVSLETIRPTNTLSSRLRTHAKSILQVSNLLQEDFSCRYLVVDDIWIPLGESLLITRFSPVWNSLIDGFGNHDPGKGRYNGLRPRWDSLHPGRTWASRCKERDETPEAIARDVETYLRQLFA